MKRLALILASSAMVLSAPVFSQEYTAANSRIKRDRQFPDQPRNMFDPTRTNKVSKTRSRAMMGLFGRCLYRRSNEGSLAFLGKTDFGFRSFQQIGEDNQKAFKNYGFRTCMSKVARAQNSSIVLSWSAEGLRQWLVEAAYFDSFKDGPDWVRPGNVVAARTYPLSERNPGVHVAMDFADCVVAGDPFTADFFYRTTADSDDEKEALDAIIPSLGPCIEEGRQMDITPFALRIWLGEALWHASTNSAPAPISIPTVTLQDPQ